MKSILFHGFCLELDPETGSKLYSYREGDGGGGGVSLSSCGRLAHSPIVAMGRAGLMASVLEDLAIQFLPLLTKVFDGLHELVVVVPVFRERARKATGEPVNPKGRPVLVKPGQKGIRVSACSSSP